MHPIEKLNNHLLELMCSGNALWRRPWTPVSSPRNGVSGHMYRGANLLVLSFAPYDDPRWLTFNQIRDRGGRVKAGEHHSPCIFSGWVGKSGNSIDESPRDDNQKSNAKLIYKYHALFNIEQTVGCSIETLEKPMPLDFSPISAANEIIQNMPERPRILDHPSMAAYCPSSDTVLMPKKNSFESSDAYYATLYHELAHSTAASHRLNRTDAISQDRAIGTYAFEELVAELTSAYLSQKTGIDNRFDQNASYISGWLKPLQDKPSMFAKASSVAQRCADYICAESKCD